MGTTIQTQHVNVTTDRVRTNVNTATTKVISNFWQKAEFNRFGIVPMLLVVVAGISGIAAAIVMHESIFKLGVIAMSTAMVESFILAVMPMRAILISSVIAVALNLLMVII